MSAVRASLAQIRKAIVASVAVAVVAAVKKWVDLDVTAVQIVLDALIVGVLVWAVPNAAQYVDPSHDGEVFDA